jgi:DnaJ domain
MSTTSSDALLELLAPDGYYSYLGIRKPSINAALSSQSGNNSTSSDDSSTNTSQTQKVFDEDIVKKNYRRLSLKHHPDKPGGDSDTFRLLNRAQRVLLNEKLRQQYDILGIDLDDDENAPENQRSEDDNGKGGGSSSSSDSGDRPSTAQGIVHEIATTILTSIIQLGVRTCKFFDVIFLNLEKFFISQSITETCTFI